MSKPHVTCRIEDAIRQGIILLGKHSSIGPYQSATRQQRFAVIHNREITIYDPTRGGAAVGGHRRKPQRQPDPGSGTPGCMEGVRIDLLNKAQLPVNRLGVFHLCSALIRRKQQQHIPGQLGGQ